MAIIKKHLLFGNEAREALLRGVNTVAHAVGSTLGPRSRNVALDVNNMDIPPTVLHDGVSVARAINVDDPFEDQGVRLLKSAALRTNEVAGDGTTTSVILAQAIINKAHQVIRSGGNPMAIKREIEEALVEVLERLKEITTDISSEDEIRQVGMISAGDPTIGKLVADSLIKVTKDGVITVEEGSSLITEVEYKPGMEIDRGYLSPYFVNKQETVEAVIEEPYILLTDKRLNYGYDVVPLLGKLLKNGVRNLVIFAGEVVEEALATLVVNRLRGGLNVVAIQAPAYGDRRIDELEDLAILTGGSPVLMDSGRELKTVEVEELGRAERVVVDRDKTVVVNGRGNTEAVKKRISDLEEQIKVSNTDYDKKIKQQRVAKLTGRMAVIHVGGATDVEIKEKKERVIDAVNATKAAVEEGIVAGGEITLLSMATRLKNTTQGGTILLDALKQPFKRLTENSGLDYAEVRERMSGKEYPWGVDVVDGQVKNLIEAGIIDPVKVVRTALENAISVATLAITTECLVAYAPEKK